MQRRFFRSLAFRLGLVVLALLGVELLVRLVAKAGWVQIRTFQTPDDTARQLADPQH